MTVEKRSITTFFHVFAWIFSLLASVVFLIFDVREWIQIAFTRLPQTTVLFIILLLIAITGSIWSLFRKISGGWLMLLGGIGLVAYFGFHGGMKDFGNMVLYGLPYVIPGIFFLLIRE